MIALYVPLLIGYFDILSDRDHYGLFPLLVAAVVVIFFVRWYSASPATDKVKSIYTRSVLIVALLIMPIAMLYYAPWLVAFSGLLAMAAGAMYISSIRRIPNLLGIWFLLCFLLRLPNQADIRLFNWMQSLSAKSGSLLLDYLGMLHVVQGNVIAFPEKDFSLKGICSGSVSLISVIAIAAAFSVIKNRKLVHSLLLILCGVVATWMLNVIRILAVSGIYARFEIDLLSGDYTYVYTIASFVVAVGMLWSFDSVLEFFLKIEPNDADEDRELQRQSKNPLTKIWIWLSELEASKMLSRFRTDHVVGARKKYPVYHVFVALLVLVTLTLEGIVVYYAPLAHRRNFMYGEKDITIIGEQSVLFDRPGWRVVDYKHERRDFDSIWGALSNTWRLKFNHTTVIVSLDYPFDGWHDVKRCYRNIGWKIVDEKIVEQLPAYKWKASETSMVLPNGDSGFVLCSHCDHLGNTVEPKPATHRLNMIRYRLDPDRWAAPFGSSMDKNRRTYYQTQCMVATPVPLDEDTKKEIRAMYAQFREQTRKAIALRALRNQTK